MNLNDFVVKYERAIKKAEILKPDLPEINLAKGNYFNTVKNDLDVALKETEIANVKRPNDPNILIQLSMITSGKGDNKKALQISESAFELDPKNLGITINASIYAFALERYGKAERWADIAIGNSPENAVGYFYKLSVILNVYGELLQSENVMKEAKRNVTMTKSVLTYWEYLICLYRRDYNAALKLHTRKEFWWNNFNQAFLLRLLNRYEEAKVYFDSLRTECFNYFSNQNKPVVGRAATLNLALAYAGLGETEKALQEIAKLDSSIKIHSADNLTYVYILLGKYNQAMQILEESVSKRNGPLPGILKLSPKLDPIRSDPRFKKIIAAAEERIKKAQQ